MDRRKVLTRLVGTMGAVSLLGVAKSPALATHECRDSRPLNCELVDDADSNEGNCVKACYKNGDFWCKKASGRWCHVFNI